MRMSFNVLYIVYGEKESIVVPNEKQSYGLLASMINSVTIIFCHKNPFEQRRKYFVLCRLLNIKIMVQIV